MEDGNGAPTLFTLDDTTNEYVEYQAPEAPAFKETLPEDIRDSEYLKDVNDPHELAKSFVDLKSNQTPPPESPDGYEFEAPDGFEIDADTFNQFKTIAHESGVNQKQFSKIMELEVSRSNKAVEALNAKIETDRAEAEAALKKEWGDSYDKKLEAAKTFLNHEKVADPAFNQFLEDTRFGDNPQVIKMFAKLADLISEDAFVKPGTGTDMPGVPRTEDGRPMLSFPSME